MVRKDQSDESGELNYTYWSSEKRDRTGLEADMRCKTEKQQKKVKKGRRLSEMKKTIKDKVSTKIKKDKKRMTRLVRTGIKAGVCDRDGGSKGYFNNPW